MRTALGFAGVLMMLAAWSVSAQQPLTPAPSAPTVLNEMVVSATEVELRSGPSKEFYPTDKLYKGARVQVVSQEQGWIAIKPPPGSISWINEKNVMVGQNSQIAAVIGQEPVAIRPAAPLDNKQPPVERTKVKPGTLIVIVGKGVVKDTGTWLPIQPVPTEVRYLPAEALQPAPGPNLVAQPGQINSSTQLLAQADRLFADGNKLQAGQLYQQVASSPNSDSSQRVWAQNRLASMQTPTTQVAGNTPLQAAPAMYNGAASNPAIAPQWSVWARLRKTTFDKDGLPMYVLQDDRGQVLLYVTTGTGFTLRDYVGKKVALYGTITYRSDGYMHTHFMTASHVATLPNQ